MLRTSVWILYQCQNVFQHTFSCSIGRTTGATRGDDGSGSALRSHLVRVCDQCVCVRVCVDRTVWRRYTALFAAVNTTLPWLSFSAVRHSRPRPGTLWLRYTWPHRETTPTVSNYCLPAALTSMTSALYVYPHFAYVNIYGSTIYRAIVVMETLASALWVSVWMNEFIRLTKITQSVKQEHRGTITACAYRCPE